MANNASALTAGSPQAPYLAPGSLQDQITYPLHVAGTPELRSHLAELLEMVNLSYLVEREGGWDTVREWKDVLSGGEKQRVAMARLFYHKVCPPCSLRERHR